VSEPFDRRRPSGLLESDPPRALQTDALLHLLEGRARPGERPEELLLDLGLVAERDFALEIAVRGRRQFVGLRGFIPDPKLFLYLPVSTAMAQRVCPLLLIGDSLKIASAYLDPDLRSVEMRFPKLELDVVISPRSEVLEALGLVTAPI
jgi:hypothetical protein